MRIGKIRVDHALRREAGRRGRALRQRRIIALEVTDRAVSVQANRVIRVVGLGLRRSCHQNCADRQDRESRNTHQILLREARLGPGGDPALALK
jgi:hypothetical protein